MPQIKVQSNETSALRTSRIPDLATLQQCLPNSVLVGFEIEHFSTKGILDVCKLGLAVLRVHEQPPRFFPCLNYYYDKNEVEVLTIRLRDRKLKKQHEDAEYRYGDKVNAKEKEASDIATNFLSKYEGDKILVGFGMRAEWRCFKEMGRDLASLFSAWVDVQELVSQRRKHKNIGPTCDMNEPGMSKTIKALHIADTGANARKHCAGNDALRNLIVLSGLATNATMHPLPQRPPKLSFYFRLAALKFYTKTRITAQDRSKLPVHSPMAVAQLFAKYDHIKAVAVNWETVQQKTEGVGVWAVEFQTEEALERFVGEVNGSIVDGTRVCVVLSSPVWKS